MSAPTATLYFLPWLRRGLARAVAAPAVGGLPTTGTTALVAAVSVDGEVVRQHVRLRGPGDVVGVAATQIARVEPPNGTTDFEPNYFAAVDLVAPDLPWMFTPAAAVADKLVPWLVLVVVRDGVDGIAIEDRGGPLPVLAITAPADARNELPALVEAWAWAHVQAATEVSATVSVTTAYAASPEAFVARLVCPRRLDAGVAYRACLVPTFEAGRRAGLGQEPGDDDTSLAWAGTTTSIELPVYYQWRFQTGANGDFESLVRRLTPRELNAGYRDLDIGSPGTAALPDAPGTLVSFAGALVSPAAHARRWAPAHRNAFQPAMRALVDKVLASTDAADPHPYDPLRDDPVVGPPAYGALAAGAARVAQPHVDGSPVTADQLPLWLGDVNLDPVQRAAAGLGADVVRRGQESLVASAWQQATAIRDINRVLGWTRLAAEVGGAIMTNKLAPLDDGSLVQLAGTACARIASGPGRTVAGALAAAAIPSGATSPAFRRIARRGGTVGRGLANAEQVLIASAVATRFTTDLASAMSFAAFIRPTDTQVAGSQILSGLPGLPSDFAAPNAPSARTRTRRAPPRSTLPPTSTSLPTSPSAPTSIAATVRAGLDPRGTLAAKLAARIVAPAAAWGGAALPAAMRASPLFAVPLYEALARLDPEYLLPGVGAIPDNTVGLANVNARFVEAFLVGANEELAREFVWREYPVDFTGTWLRTFWSSLDGAADIGAVAGWAGTALGKHQIGGASDGTLALVVTGALMRRYPDTAIYAVEAQWSGGVREEKPGGERRDPLFVGALGASAQFVGFALTTAEAIGAVDAAGAPDPHGSAGWFFVFEEAQTGTRFGLDVAGKHDAGTMPHFWKNVSWGHLVDDLDALDALTHAPAGGRLDGVRLRYDKGMFFEVWGAHAAAMARITYQRPVRVLVHASVMLPEGAA
jgi:hypothetical protein